MTLNEKTCKQILIILAVAAVAYLIYRWVSNSRAKEEQQDKAQAAVANAAAERDAQQAAAEAAYYKAAEQQAATPAQPQLLDGDDSSLHGLINSDKVSVVMFYAPWCGHCKTAMPDYQELPRRLDPARFQVIRIDCEANKGSAAKFDIPGFPCYKRFKAGKPLDSGYEGDRSLLSLEKYAKS